MALINNRQVKYKFPDPGKQELEDRLQCLRKQAVLFPERMQSCAVNSKTHLGFIDIHLDILSQIEAIMCEKANLPAAKNIDILRSYNGKH